MGNKLEEATSTDLLVNEARRRGISIISFTDIDPNTFIFELNGHREPIRFSRTDHTGAVTNQITNNKFITTTILRQAGFPVPDDLVTNDLIKAEGFLAKHKQVVVKPIGNTGGTGITTDVTTISELRKSFEMARDLSFTENKSRQAIFQQHVAGDDYRVLVINRKRIFSIHRIPAGVLGDGVRTVSQLIEQWNQQRKPQCHIQINTSARHLLKRQNLTLTSVPKKNQSVRLAGVSNYHAGGSIHDATDALGSTVKQMAKEIAIYFNTGIIGIDFISPDISQTPGLIIELNSTPDLTIHHTPDTGKPRNATAAVLDLLFPETIK